MLLSNRSFYRLPITHQKALRVAGAESSLRFSDLGRRQDEELLGELFKHQGVTAVPVSDSLRADYFAAAKAARDRIGEQFVPKTLLERVLRMLADYRAEHHVVRAH